MHFRTKKAYVRGIAGGAFRGRPFKPQNKFKFQHIVEHYPFFNFKVLKRLTKKPLSENDFDSLQIGYLKLSLFQMKNRNKTKLEIEVVTKKIFFYNTNLVHY